MIAVHMLYPDDVAARLTGLGFEQLPECTLEGHGLWRTPWGHHFFVPEVGPDHMCAEYILERVIEDALRTRPNPPTR
jgi:hypothetical protein